MEVDKVKKINNFLFLFQIFFFFLLCPKFFSIDFFSTFSDCFRLNLEKIVQQNQTRLRRMERIDLNIEFSVEMGTEILSWSHCWRPDS